MKPWIPISLASLFCPILRAAEVLMTLMENQCFTKDSSAIAPIYDLSDDAWRDYSKSTKIPNVAISYATQTKKLCQLYDCYDEKQTLEKAIRWTKRSSFLDPHISNLITDRRWEEFPTYFTKHINERGEPSQYLHMENVEVENLKISFSLQTDHGANLLVCSKPSNKYYCERIVIDAINGTKTVNKITSCIQIDYENVPRRLSCGSSTVMPGGKKLTERDRWHHFSIIKNGDQLTFSTETGDTYKHKMDVSSFSVGPYVDLFAYSERENGLWKLHLFDYYHTNELGTTVFTLEASTGHQHQCVSMFLTMCYGCQLGVQFLIYNNTKWHVIKIDDVQVVEEGQWQEKTFCFKISEEYPKTDLYLRTRTMSLVTTHLYWALSDIRLSTYNAPLRILKPSVGRWTGRCQYLGPTHVNVLDKNAESTNLENWQRCSEYEFGEDCTPCNVTEGVGLCPKYGKYCQLFREGPKQPVQRNCYCHVGYEGFTCQKPCRPTFYGHSCKNSCPNCQNGCSNDTIHGYCDTELCTDNFTGRKCDIPSGIFIFNNPPEMQVGARSCTLTLKSFDGIGNDAAMTKYVFQYRQGGIERWRNFPEPFLNFGHTEKVELKKLRPDTRYELRVLGFVDPRDLDDVSKSNHHLAPKLRIYNFTPSCKVIKASELHVKPTKDSVEICINPDKADSEPCVPKRYNIKLNDTIKVPWKKKHCFAAQDLNPFTHYLIQVTMHEEHVFDVPFYTLESVPSKVRDFVFTVRTSSSIYLMWKPPETPNGVLLYYRITATLKSRRACLERPTKPTTIHLDVRSHETFAHLTGLRPYSLYEIDVAANTSAGFGELEHPSDNVETWGIDQIQDEEFPVLKDTIPGVTSVAFSFSHTSCEFRMGYLRILIEVRGPGCANSSSFYNISEQIEVGSLTPFCSYQARFQLSRENGFDREFGKGTEFTTLEGVPNTVRNLLVTSKGPDHIALRWLPPHPPTGSLERYIITVSSPNNSFRPKQIQIPVKKCELWTELEYHCATVNTTENIFYILEVQAKNKGNGEYSQSSNATAQAKETRPGKPWNFDYLWTAENYLNLTWCHPNETNGLLKSFDIHIKEVKFESYIIHSGADYRSKYSTQITNTTLPFANQFYVLISARNSIANSDDGKLSITSPPPIPQNIIEGTRRESSSIEVAFKQTADQPNFLRFAYIFISMYGDSPLDEGIAHLENHHRSSDQPLQALSIGDWTLIYRSQLTERFIEKLTISNTSAEANYTVTPAEKYTLAFVWVHKYLNYTRSNHTIKEIGVFTPSRLGGASIMLFLAVTVLIVVVVSGALVARRFKFQLHVQQIIRDWLASLDRHDAPIIAGSDLQPSEHTYVNRQDVLLHELKRGNRLIATVRPISVLDPGAEICPGVPSFKTVHSMRVKLEDFYDYVKQAIKSEELARQHKLFPTGMVKGCAYGSLPENKQKNRYQNLTAYDHSRVVLKKVNGDDFSDYINANFVDGYRHPKAYIATQGPKKDTVGDFWRMVWQSGVSHIVMVANVIEGGKKKVEQYWPDLHQEEIFGGYKVTHVSSEAFANYECRRLTVQYMFSKPREITHLHFKMWPDHGVPVYPQSLLPFVQRLLSLRSTDFPMVVHCSAGVGRTGTIILCDISLRMAAHEGHIDLLSMLEHIRNQRPNMVDNIEQYKLAHLVILNCLMGLRTGVKINNDFHKALKGLEDLNLQLNYIRDCEWQDEAMRSVAGLEQPPLIVKEKNRFSNIVPDTVARVYLQPYPAAAPSASSTYINAVQVDGFSHPRKFIVTQYPLPNTIADFWRMVMEQEISVVVCLNQLPLPSCKKFWPDVHEELRPVDAVKVRHVRTKFLSVCKVFTLEICTSYGHQQNQIWVTNLLSFTGWKYPSSTPLHNHFITFVEDVAFFNKDASRVLVSCYDGATASGLFVALSFLLKKVKIEQEVDVCQAVRSIRTSRKEFVNTKEQLEFLYKAVVLYVEERYMSYANISSTTSK